MDEDFFTFIEKNVEVSVPNFLKEALKRERFDNFASFRQIKDNQTSEFFNCIEFQIKRMLNSSEDCPSVSDAKHHFKETHGTTNINHYVLPLGFKIKLLAIREFCVENYNLWTTD